MLENERDVRHRELRDLEDKLRDRIHDALKASSKVEGMVTEVRVSSNERHTRLEEQQRQTRTEVASIDAKLDGLRDAVDTKLEIQRTTMETKLEAMRTSMSSDMKAFSKEVGQDLGGLKEFSTSIKVWMKVIAAIWTILAIVIAAYLVRQLLA